jgi:cystathionine beta-lyase
VTHSYETALSELEGGYGAVATSTGLAAITTAVWAFVQAGDHILVADSAYIPTRVFCESLKRFGVDTEYYAPTIGRDIQNLFRANTRLVFLESPGSFTLEVQDVPAITEVCRKQRIKTLIDNTWATPLFFQPLRHGVDVSIHSGTKYLTGHADSFLGIAICNDEDSFTQVRTSAIQLGQYASAENIHAGVLGLKTLDVRLSRHQKQALQLIERISQRPEIKRIIYPALPGSDGHEIWKRDFSGATGLFSLILKSGVTPASVDRMLDNLKIFGLGHSWGGYESLIVPANPSEFRTKGWDETETLLRIHVGFEDIEDLAADLIQGFNQLEFPN